MARAYTYEYVKNKIEEIGYILLSNEYISAMSKILVLCPNGHKWETTYSKIQQKRRCPYCSGKFNNIQTIKEIVESEEGYTLISTEATQLRDKVEIECGKGHHYFCTVNNFKLGRRCPHCNESKGEKRIEKILNNYNVQFIKQYTFEDCKCYNKLPFDFYLPQYDILIEYDGELHYKIIKQFGGVDNLIRVKIRDTIKNIYCQQNNIKLIRIPYWDFDKIEEILKRNLNK